MRFAALWLLVTSLGLAKTWSGLLVDSNCYANEQSNVNKDQTTVDRDMDMEVRYCSPNSKTKTFGIVLADWNSLKFDSAGNAKAAGLIGSAAAKAPLEVRVSGDLKKDTIAVSSVSAAETGPRR